MFLNFKYIQTTPGIFKLINVIVGLVSVALIGAGHDKQNLMSVPSAVLCNNLVGPCGQIWAGEMAMTIIILAWLFSLSMLLASLIFKSTMKSVYFGHLDIFGHLLVGILLTLADVFIIVYYVTYSRIMCSNYEANNTGSPWYFSKCTAKLILIIYSFIFWILGLIFTIGYTILVFVTSFVVRREGAALAPDDLKSEVKWVKS